MNDEDQCRAIDGYRTEIDDNGRLRWHPVRCEAEAEPDHPFCEDHYEWPYWERAQ